MAPIGAEREVAGPHRARKPGRHRLLPERKVARALNEVLKEQIEGALFRLADHDLNAIEGEAFLLADIVVQACVGRRGLRGAILDLGHGRSIASTALGRSTVRRNASGAKG